MDSVKDRYAALQPEVDKTELASVAAEVENITTVAHAKAALQNLVKALGHTSSTPE